MPDISKIKIAGVEYDIKDTTARENTGGSVALDTTLTKAGQAADAKAVGDAISTLSEEIAGLSSVSMEPADDDIPKVFFTGTAPTTKAEGELPLVMDYRSKTKTIRSYVTLKVQGDSSAGYAKKNFNLKMFSDSDRSEKLKVTFRDWSKTNKYCLKANWIDHTHARNVVGGRLWAQVVRSRADYDSYPTEYKESANCGAVNGFPVKVYLNGVYQGLYTWNIYKDSSMFNMDDETGTHAALIADANNSVTVWRSLPTIDGSDWTDELNEVVPDAVKTGFQNAYSFVMESTDEEFIANIEQYFYLSSLIDYFIYIYCILMYGGLAKSQTMFTYDAAKYLANIYDMDTTWALKWDGSGYYDVETACPSGYSAEVEVGASNLLYERLVSLFPDEIKARYAELRGSVLTDANIINEFERFMDVIGNDLYAEDYATTTAGGAFADIPSKTTNTLQNLREIIVARMGYCDVWIPKIGEAMGGGSTTEEIPATGITLDITSIEFTSAGTKTLTATVTPENTTDEVIWNSSDSTVATVSGGVVTAVGDGDCTITATCGDYSASCSVNVSGIQSSVTWQQKTIATSNGAESASSTRISTVDMISVDSIEQISVNDGYDVALVVYNASGDYIGFVRTDYEATLTTVGSASAIFMTTWDISQIKNNLTNVATVRLLLRKTDNSEISVSDGANVNFLFANA